MKPTSAIKRGENIESVHSKKKEINRYMHTEYCIMQISAEQQKTKKKRLKKSIFKIIPQ